MKLKDLEVLVLCSDSPESDRRQDTLKNAAVLERLREELPGWISREWIVDRNGTAENRWPVALIKFKQPSLADSTQDADPGMNLEARWSEEKSSGTTARLPTVKKMSLLKFMAQHRCKLKVLFTRERQIQERGF
jgi:hypothetical protein